MNQGNEFTESFNGESAVWIQESIMPYFHKPLWQHMLKKPPDKFHGLKLHGLPRLSFTIFIGKRNGIIFNGFDAVIGDGNAEHIPCKIAK